MHMMRVVEKKTEGLRGNDIGDILINAGRMTRQDLNRIVALQRKEEILFGAAAVALGYLARRTFAGRLAASTHIPKWIRRIRTLSKELIAAHDPADPRVESLRSIRSGLMFLGAGNVTKTIAVVSPDAGEGKTFVAANLAVVFAQMGMRTILVDLNFRSPRVHSLFQIKNNTGASSLIIKRAFLENAVQESSINALAVLSAGPKPPNPLELLNWQATKDLVWTLTEKFDLTIIDTPAFTKTADAMMIASLCDGALITALKGKTKLNAFDQVKKQLEGSCIRILGSVVNEIGKK